MSDEVKIGEARWTAEVEDLVAAAMHGVRPATSVDGWTDVSFATTSPERQEVWRGIAVRALHALADAGLLAALSAPSEPVPDGPRVWAGVELPAGGETREEWRVSGDTNGPHAIDDGPWERIYTDRTYAAGHVDVLKRGHPEVTVGFHRRTVVTFTGEWSEVVEEATP